MNKPFSRSVPRAVLALSLLVGATQASTAWAQSVNSLHDRIVGLWDVQVTILDCDTGAQLASFRGLHKYELGGTAQVVPATAPAALSAHMGVWKHVERNDYQLIFKMFRFDGAGNNIGWAVVTNDISISEDETQYGGAGRAEFFDSNGNHVATSCPTFTGTRFP